MVRLLPSIQRDRARDRLKGLLAVADDAAFCRMIWAVDALQNGEPEVAASFLIHPDEAVGADVDSKYRVHHWVMETLVNELLSSPKQGVLSRRPTRKLNCSHFDAIAALVNALNALEDAEVAVWLRKDNVLLEMHRIAQRQFHWQRGFLNLPQFYRSAFLYGFETADDLFRTRRGVSIADVTRCGFAIYAYLAARPFMPLNVDLSAAEISTHVRDATLRLLALSHDEARAKAAELRAHPGPVAYKPSILRRFPCIVFGTGDKHLSAPIRDLIVQRVTSGIYYDLQGDGRVRNGIAERFETYCERLIKGFLPEIEVTREFEYDRGRKRTPDLILANAGSVFAVADCKANKMTVQAKFSDQPLDDAKQGYDEMLKGVLQVWRFFSGVRRGVVPLDNPVDPNAIGLVLTLDGWLELFGSMRGDMLSRARAHAQEHEPSILQEDMRPVIFCPIDDLEATLSRASPATFFATLRAATTERYAGYHLSSVHSGVHESETVQKPYTFKERMTDVLPWWGHWRDVPERRSWNHAG